jgi:regulator of protease activity HflC (stomatin/prohibitin superfamily)
MNPGLFLLGAIALFVIVTVAKGIRIVQQAQTMVIERLGKFHRALP